MAAGRQADMVELSDEDRPFPEGQVRRHKVPRSLYPAGAGWFFCVPKVSRSRRSRGAPHCPRA